MIQEYRKQSAEWMGFKVDSQVEEGCFWFGKFPETLQMWHPDQSHDQMAMIEDKLIEKGWGISYVYCRVNLGNDFNEWGVRFFRNNKNSDVLGVDKDKRIAFMKAWMEYIKTK